MVRTRELMKELPKIDRPKPLTISEYMALKELGEERERRFVFQTILAQEFAKGTPRLQALEWAHDSSDPNFDPFSCYLDRDAKWEMSDHKQMGEADDFIRMAEKFGYIDLEDARKFKLEILGEIAQNRFEHKVYRD